MFNYVCADVFEKFRDEQGNISSDDVSYLLMLYDAAHLRTHGEEILDNIITFNKSHLQSLLLENLEPGPVHFGDTSVQAGQQSRGKALHLSI